MEIEIRVISIETIKPSSPTPKSLQKYQLSFLDQREVTSMIPLVYFYSSNPKFSISEKSKHLKKSLSEVLSIYYPLAGRLAGNLYVDCNDAGTPFSEVETDCDLSQLITNTKPNNLHNFLPYETDEFHDLCLAVQATYFHCGGLVVGILLSRKIADALSFISFVNTWSAVARSLVPLQDRYTVVGGSRPSRVEALSAFIWTRFVSDTGMRSDPGKICMVYNAINLPSRADPPLPEYHMGNMIWVSSASAMAAAVDGGGELLVKVRKTSENREMQLKEIRAGARDSLCGFPFYEADFGWGRPDRVSFYGSPFKNTASFMDTKSRGGIEVLIQLTKHDVEKSVGHLILKSTL